jgi:hypothetical protein
VDDLVTWLVALVAEDERLAREAIQETTGRWTVRSTDWGGGRLYVEDDCGAMILHARYPNDPQYPHIARWDPARVAIECESKRQMIQLHCRIWLEPGAEEFNDAHLTREPMPVCAECRPEGMFRRATSWPCRTLKALALPYADRPGYREQWKP